jgi:hypothetical protein
MAERTRIADDQHNFVDAGWSVAAEARPIRPRPRVRPPMLDQVSLTTAQCLA